MERGLPQEGSGGVGKGPYRHRPPVLKGIFEERPNEATGGPHSPYGEGGLRHSNPPLSFSPCKAETKGDVVDP